MGKNIKITLSGGFHNSDPVNVVISKSDYDDLKTGVTALWGALSSNQLRRMMKHFCGCKECGCGGVLRASWEIASK